MRSRRSYLAGLAIVVALGIASRLHPIDLPLWDKWLGDVLYAVAAYLVLALVAPRWPPARLATAAFLFCLAIEFLKLTGIPARCAHILLLRWLLGVRFAWGDIGCYMVGVIATAAIERWLGPPRAHRLGSEGR